jgi:hypothetical protein
MGDGRTMSDYLAGYGVKDEKRERRTKRIILGLIAILIIGSLLYLVLHNFTEKRAANRFLDDLRAKNYQTAYRMWGCTEQAPCRDYSFERFMADWGPNGTYPNPSKLSFGDVDSCGGGVVMTIVYPGSEPAGLYVDRSTKVLSFAPWPRCPGRHWNFKSFWQNLFGKTEPPPPPQ